MSACWDIGREKEQKSLLHRDKTFTPVTKRLHNVHALHCGDEGAGGLPNCGSHSSVACAGGRTNRWLEENSSFGYQQRATDDLMIISHSAIIYMGI